MRGSVSVEINRTGFVSNHMAHVKLDLFSSWKILWVPLGTFLGGFFTYECKSNVLQHTVPVKNTECFWRNVKSFTIE